MSEPALPVASVVENLRQVFFVYDLTARRLQYVNQAAGPVLGLRPTHPDEDLAALLRTLHPDDHDYAAECLDKLVRGRLHEDVEVRLVRAGGATQWVCLKAAVHPQPAGPVLLSGLVEDITAGKEYSRNAERFNNKKNSTLEILSHDLAGPLNVIYGAAVEVRARTQQLPDASLQELLRIIEETCRESVNLIHDFVDTEFFDSVNVELHRERVDLVERVGITVDNYRRGQQSLNISFELRASHPAIYLSIDENKLMQVLNNLIGNALKFTPDGGRIAVELWDEPDHVRIAVADSGIGIPEALLPVLFDKFTKARRTGLRGEKATGLGMSIIKTIVELHRGRIWVESTEGHGTTFYLKLPKDFDAAGRP
ncbi:PAS domain-containing protein [Hymenobacter busanensis]|uniref:histidine kinase n=1 Tax=Hymenobacter busanensis TaxID=2607656 RepID=A0A7L4ZYR7_9BACT|nr:PAS domain-containing sensor histidine kinase [Hymenobacter busanensis]KAA9333128.1 PAS domain-containing protein [Hymenobacter busanensis]QHJ08197.1 PAS domain-containing protein [Hymenobacter busanensis]